MYDVDSGQKMETTIIYFLWSRNESFCQNFELLVMIEWVRTCNDLNS
jgi:hypothetical protein